jgi:hypothetical protein
MKKWSWISAALFAGVVGCSSGSQGNFGQGSTDLGGSSGGGSSGGSSSGGNGSSGGSSSGGNPDDVGSDGGLNIPADAAVHYLYDSSIPDASLDAPITLTMDSFTVMPGQEVYMCQQFGNPFGHDVDLVKMDGYMDAGSHHFFLFNMSPLTTRNKAAPLVACPGGGKEFHPFPYLSQTPGHYIVTYPEANMGYPLVGNNGLMMNAHYLNTGSTPITPHVSITIYPAKAGVVTTHVGSIFLNNLLIDVPAYAKAPAWYSTSGVPITAENYTIITNWSHMHQWATDFQALTNNKVFYEEPSWSEPPLITAAPAGVTPVPKNTSPNLPMQMTAGQSIQWQCQYANTTNPPIELTFGDSAQTNVMCIYVGQYYPADTTSPDYPDIVSVIH